MNGVYAVLLLLSVACFAFAVGESRRGWDRLQLVALGLFFFVLVPTIQTLRVVF